MHRVKCVSLNLYTGDFPLTVNLRTLPIGRNVLTVSAMLVGGVIVTRTISITGGFHVCNLGVLIIIICIFHFSIDAKPLETQEPACSSEDTNLDIIVSCDLGRFPPVVATECQFMEGSFVECKKGFRE